MRQILILISVKNLNNINVLICWYIKIREFFFLKICKSKLLVLAGGHVQDVQPEGLELSVDEQGRQGHEAGYQVRILSMPIDNYKKVFPNSNPV